MAKGKGPKSVRVHDLVTVKGLDGYWYVTAILAKVVDGAAVLVVHRDGVRRVVRAERVTGAAA
jgi:hypothetical protein